MHVSLGTGFQKNAYGMPQPKSQEPRHIFGLHNKRKRNFTGGGKHSQIKSSNIKPGPVKLPKSLAALIPKKYLGMAYILNNLRSVNKHVPNLSIQERTALAAARKKLPRGGLQGGKIILQLKTSHARFSPPIRYVAAANYSIRLHYFLTSLA